MINIEEERKAFEIEWIKLGGDFKSFSIIDNMYVLIPSVASAGNVIKELAERAVNSAFALWLIQSRQKQVVIDDLNSQLEKAKATPEGFVLVPKVITDEWMAVYVELEVSKYCKEFEGLPFAVTEKDLPMIQEDFRRPIKAAHSRLMKVIEAQEQSHD